MKIITVSDTECGDKPTKYCAVIVGNAKTHELECHVRNGIRACGADPENLRAGHVLPIAADLCNDLKHNGYVWIAERFLVEITDVDAPWQSYRRSLMFELALKCIENGMISVSERASLPEMHRGWAEETIEDALRCALKKEMRNERS